MILQKVSSSGIHMFDADVRHPKLPGISADTRWGTLSMSVKERVVAQIAEYLKVMFALRFNRAGSLYLSSPSNIGTYVGPIVSTPFYSALDGIVRPGVEPSLSTGLSQ